MERDRIPLLAMDLDPAFENYNFSELWDPTMKSGPGKADLYRFVKGQANRRDRHASAEFADAMYWTLRQAAFEAFQRDHGARAITYQEWFCQLTEIQRNEAPNPFHLFAHVGGLSQAKVHSLSSSFRATRQLHWLNVYMTIAGNQERTLGQAENQILTLSRLAFVVTLIQFLQFCDGRSIANHIFGVVSELPHDFQKFPFPPDRDVEIDACEKHRKTLIAALSNFPLQLP